MAALFMSLLGALRSAFHTRAELALENLALRQQLANLRHTVAQDGRSDAGFVDDIGQMAQEGVFACVLSFVLTSL